MRRQPTDEPQPTLAYLMTDVAGSTRLWETKRKDMACAVARLDEVCEQTIGKARGCLLKSRGEGDSHFGVFRSAEDALVAATNILIATRKDPLLRDIVLRAGINIGSAESWAGDHYGPVVNRCARIRQAARPGQILVSEAVHAIASPNSAFMFKDLGVHRLRDLMQPERLFQLLHPELESDFAPPDSLSELSHNLPSYLSSFVGRSEDLAELGRVIGANRLVTVTGAGGVGKTRLTQQVAAERVEEFKDGAWFIDLAQTDRTESVLPILCKEIDAGIDATEERLVESLEHRHMLLILDNCEHLYEECRRLAQTLLQRCSKLRVLATSRRMLEVRGEYVYKLGGLRLPGPDQLHDALQFDGIRLFVERARQRGTILAVDDSSMRGIVALCAKLDGLPLAIEMAASLTDVLSVPQIAQSIEECLDVPTGLGADDLRQHTISATIDWSRRLLSPDAQTLLERVAFFPNTWTLEAAGEVCLPEAPRARVRDLAKELVNHSLVFTTRTPQDDIRFGLLQTTRQVIANRSGPQSDLGPAYIAYCRKIVEAAQSLMDSGEEAKAHERVDQDYETLIKALDISFALAPADCATMALALRTFWMSGTRLPEGRAWYEKLSTCDLIDRSTRVSVQIALSSLYILLGDNDKAHRVLVEAEETVQPIGGFELARVIGNLAVHRDRMGRYEEAKEGFERCCQLCREFGAKREESLSLMNLGVAKLRLKEPLSECAELFRQALECARSAGLASMQAKAYSCLAHVELKEGRLNEALASNRQALLLWLADPIVPDCNLAMLDLAEIFATLDRFDAAARAIHIAERLEELSQSPLPSLHRARLDSSRDLAKTHISSADWRSGQRLTRSKGVRELTTMAIQIIDLEEAGTAPA